jgi:hypothetical protein
MLTTAHAREMSVSAEERERQTTTMSFTKEDYLTVNRFESKCNNAIFNWLGPNS